MKAESLSRNSWWSWQRTKSTCQVRRSSRAALTSVKQGWGRTICHHLYSARCGPAPAHTRLTAGCGPQRALLPVAVGAMNIHDVRERTDRETDVRRASSLNAPEPGGGCIISIRSLGTLNQEKLATANRSRVSIRSQTCENMPLI